MSLGTKVLSARVPFEFYIKLLEEAQKAGMNISDYLIIKLTNADNNKIAKVDNPDTLKKINELSDQVLTLKDKITEQESKIHSLSSQNYFLEQENQKLGEYVVNWKVKK